jgi:hypothetical protein
MGRQSTLSLASDMRKVLAIVAPPDIGPKCSRHAVMLAGSREVAMTQTQTQTLDPLVLDLLHWLAREPRPYHEVLDAWRTSCPRLTVWEDAMDAGYVAREFNGAGPVVRLTPQGQAFLAANGRGR